MKATLPTLESERLTLRPFRLGDASDVQRFAGSKKVADMVTLIPHPYPDGMAEEWIGLHSQWFEDRRRITLAIEEKETGNLVGTMTLHLELAHHRAEIGYWIGKPFWEKGYCTEAARSIIEFGQTQFGLRRIYGRCLSRNKASAKVLKKLGMIEEGCLVKHVLKAGVYEDLDLFGMSLHVIE